MAIDVDRVPGRDLAERDEASPQGGLEVQAVLHGDVLEEAVLGGGRGEKGEAGEETEVGAADRIDGATAGGRAENRRKDEAESEALLRQALVLGRASRRDEVRGAQFQEGGTEEEATSARRGQPAFEESGDVMRDVVPGDDAWAWLAGAVEDVDLLCVQESGGEWRGCQPFFLPGRRRPAPVRRVWH